MNILGIHDGHNASVCLMEDGRIKSLIQEERLQNEKNYSGFPEKSLHKALDLCGLKPSDIDYYVFGGNHIPAPKDRMGVMDGYLQSDSPKAKAKSVLKKTPVYSWFKSKRKEDRISHLVRLGIPQEKIRFVEHHLTHASTAYYGAGTKDKSEKVLVLTQDGSGDGLSGTVSIGQGGKITRIASINKEDSLGRIYATTTFMLGMVPLEHEYKLMGMAPYAPEAGRKRSKKVFEDLLHFSGEEGLVWKRRSGLPAMQMIYPHLRKATEFHRFDWIAAGLQEFTEEMLVQWVKNAIAKTGIKKLALAGGTFMNVKANQRISEIEEVEDIFVFPSCGDESNAIGAAWHLHHELNPDDDMPGLDHVYHGPDHTDKDSVLKEIDRYKATSSTEFEYNYHEDVEAEVAKLLAGGEIVARCKGPMEFGARSLGNRAILCDAGDLRKVTIINNMIKKRDFWMPFAPIMLKERSHEYVLNPKGIEAPYMIFTMDSTDKHEDYIGGVQQVDLTARPQFVDGTRNPELYRLLKAYEKLSGKGVMINTSFNLHGLPMVYGPAEALYVFENSGLVYLNIGNYILKKV